MRPDGAITNSIPIRFFDYSFLLIYFTKLSSSIRDRPRKAFWVGPPKNDHRTGVGFEKQPSLYEASFIMYKCNNCVAFSDSAWPLLERNVYFRLGFAFFSWDLSFERRLFERELLRFDGNSMRWCKSRRLRIRCLGKRIRLQMASARQWDIVSLSDRSKRSLYAKMALKSEVVELIDYFLAPRSC